MSTYAGIYDVVAGNMQQAGKTFEYEKNTFLCDVCSHPQNITVSKYTQLSNREFLQAIYVAAVKRLPERREEEFWAQKYNMPQAAFQEEVLRCLTASSVVAINHIRFVDNPYFEQKLGLKYKLLGRLYGLTDKSNLRELGKKLPQPIQKIIRKVFL